MVCSECKKKYQNILNPPELNYNNYQKYGFTTKEKFKNHKSNSIKCPVKTKIQIDNASNQQNTDELIYPFYEPYNSDIDEKTYIWKQETRQNLLKFYLEHNKRLWFVENEIATYDILKNLKLDTQFITLVAEPGAGKTNTIHCLIYNIGLQAYENSISQNSITITTQKK